MTMVSPSFDNAPLRRQASPPAYYEPAPLWPKAHAWVQAEVTSRLEELAGMALTTEQAMEYARGLTVEAHLLVRGTAEAIGRDLENVHLRSGQGSSNGDSKGTTPGRLDTFTGTADVPGYVAAFDRELLKDFGSDVLELRQLACRNMAETVSGSLRPPEAYRHPRGVLTRLAGRYA